ncbi:polyhedrin major occlusion body protein [Neodiprion abietis nucleopolyhedrovirus]|uniref:Polyhedrin major occlusion body protein n=1 Tax=Neodiprion abietis nucleopolyhedrovirus TaxID=204507 RepID=Q0ZP79_9CBAC|nr:polyhedrin major occlusion body protein [Neodiprion abietis nucleopolyhedrovirus]ABC74875.1 polyhedrin major occlusion body protein [Neodiprion abietis nucleopolyhedrovirus]
MPNLAAGYQTSAKSYIYDNKYYRGLGDIINSAKKRKHDQDWEKHAEERRALNGFILPLDPRTGPGKHVKMVMFQEVRNIKANTMKLAINWSGREYLREVWTTFIEDTFPINNYQEFTDVFLEIRCTPNKSNRHYRFLAQHGLRMDEDFVPCDTIRVIEPEYLQGNTVSLSLLKRDGGCPMMKIRQQFNELDLEQFVDRILWCHFHRPIVYIGTDSGEEEEVFIEASLTFIIKEFAPEAPFVNGPGM